MQTIQQQIADARAACNAFYHYQYRNGGHLRDYWPVIGIEEQNAWHAVVVAVRERKGEAE